MARPAPIADERLKRLRDWVVHHGIGSAQPVELTGEDFEDTEGRAVLRLIVVLDDPPGGNDTWSPEDVAALERVIRDKALEVDLPWPWTIDIQSKTPEDEGEEEQEEE